MTISRAPEKASVFKDLVLVIDQSLQKMKQVGRQKLVYYIVRIKAPPQYKLTVTHHILI